MKFIPTSLFGAYIIELDKKKDRRGFFARIFCREEYKKMNLKSNILQINSSFNKQRGIIRGLHFQLPPKAETKIVKCIQGRIYDVIIDLRKNSPTFEKWYGVELSAQNTRMLYVPEGFAHGYQSLEDDTEIIYFVTEFYSPEYERGIRWNDTYFNIKWVLENPVLSDKDQSYSDYYKNKFNILL